MNDKEFVLFLDDDDLLALGSIGEFLFELSHEVAGRSAGTRDEPFAWADRHSE